MRKSSINNFSKGMNKDLDKSIIPNDSYIHAENFRIVASDNASTGSLESVLGNTLLTSIDTGGVIVGHCFVRNDLILFSSYKRGTIYKIVIDDYNNVLSNDIIWDPDDTGSTLNLTSNSVVKAVGRYESEDIKKVYFTDGENNLRFFNYADSNFSTTSSEEFEILRKAFLTTPYLSKITKGNLLSGMVQYVYKLYDIHGSETLFSDISNMYHVSQANEGDSDSKYYGSDRDVNTGKGYLVAIDSNSDFDKFDRLELVAIHYNTLNGEPVIRILDRIIISGSVSTYTVLDYGQSIGSYSIDEITIMNTALFSATDLATKNNYLFASNITEKYFDVDNWDARAYRWTTKHADNAYTKVFAHLYDDINNRITLEYTPSSGVKSTKYYKKYIDNWELDSENKYGKPSSASGWNVPETHNCINYYNSSYKDSLIESDYNTCAFQASSEVLGGEGTNVSYLFSTYTDTIDKYSNINGTFDSAKMTGDYIFSDTDGSSYSYSSPFYEKHKSFQRDETYRMYIILEDNKGRESFPKWIGDIRMPSALDYNGYIVPINQSNKIVENVIYRVVGESGSSITYNSNTYNVGSSVTGVSGQTSYTSSTGARLLLSSGSSPVYNINSSNQYDFQVFHTQNDVGGITNLKYTILNVKFKVKNLPSTVRSFKISYVPREEKDKSILAQGMISRCAKYGNNSGDRYVANIWPTSNSVGGGFNDFADNKLWNFVSPEISFNNAVRHQTSDVLQVITSCTFQPISIINSAHTYTGDVGTAGIYRYSVHKPENVNNPNKDFYSQIAYNGVISDGKILPPSLSDIYNIGDYTYTNKALWNISITNKVGIYCKNMVLALSSSLTGLLNTEATSTYICNYKRDVFNSQYGGNTYNSRQNSKSTTCSKRYTATTSGYNIEAHGDTYIGLFDVSLVMYDSNISSADRICYQAAYIPVESTVNVLLRNDESTCKLFDNDNVIYIKEQAGKHYKGVGDTEKDSSYYNQTYDLYRYNSVYSRSASSKLYSPKPVDWTEEKIFDTRIKYSDLKINNEEIDSWGKFRTSNYKEVDSAYGAVNNLQIFNNSLYFWQNDGFGVLSVNPRSLIRDNNNLELTLGTGSVLDRFDYISTKGGGNIYPRGITTSQYAIYWLDSSSKDIYKFNSNGIESLSKLKNIRSYINNIDNIYNVLSTYDSKNNEILFTIYRQYYKEVLDSDTVTSYRVITLSSDNLNLSSGDSVYVDNNLGTVSTIDDEEVTIYYRPDSPPEIGDMVYIRSTADAETIVYNEFADCFPSYYTIKPTYYIEVNYNILSTNNGIDLYLHNLGDYGKFYGTVYDSTLKTIVNSDFYATKVFDNLSFFTSSFNGGLNILYDTWNEVRFYNDYQNTDYIRLVPGEIDSIVRRERGWSMQIPRNAVIRDVTSNLDIFDPANLSTEKEFPERLRDKYMVIDFIYENSHNYKFNIPYIITDYRYSIR